MVGISGIWEHGGAREQADLRSDYTTHDVRFRYSDADGRSGQRMLGDRSKSGGKRRSEEPRSHEGDSADRRGRIDTADATR